MNQNTSSLIVFLPALALLSFTQISSAADTPTAARHTIIAQSGLAAPAGGNYSPFSFLNAMLNARSFVAFDAFVGGPPFTSRVFLGDGKTTSTIALGANPDPSGP